jgi:UDP-glucose 4-epimerase
MHNKKCIVFGADGYIGRHLMHFLLEAGNTVKAYGLTPNAFSADFHYQVVDIVTAGNLQGIDWDVDAVFMFAGLAGTHAGFEQAEQFIQVNEIGLVNILEAIRRSGSHPRVIFPSTRLVYQGCELALTEEDCCLPKTVYAVNKLACEQLLNVYSNSFAIDHTIYRICVPYGNTIGTTYSYGTVGTFIKQAVTNRIIQLYGDGSLRRTFTHVEDLCRQILITCLADASRNQIFNTLGEDISLRCVAEIIADKTYAKLEFTPFPEKDWLIESGHTVFNASKLQQKFAFSLKHTMLAWVEKIPIDNANLRTSQPNG